MGKYFGTDGARGKANEGLTAELAFKLGRAGAYVLTKQHSRPRIFVGKDTRISGDMLEAALVAGICSTGADALILGVIPTPAIARLTKVAGADAGVMISASHNPFGDNGIKFFNGEGYKLSDALEEEIEDIIINNRPLPHPTDEKIGRIITYGDAVEAYIDMLTRTADEDLAGMDVVLDCANGAASAIAPEVFRRLGANVHAIFDKPDGININDNCGSTHIGSLQAVIKERGGIGFAFDGDADRMIAVDERGNVIDGDNVMAICAEIMNEAGTLKKSTVVGTVMSNMGLEEHLGEIGINMLRTKVGDRYILEKMLQDGYNLGGEESGHVIFLDSNTTGDGTLAAVKLACAVKKRGKALFELRESLKQYPKVLINVRVSGERDIAKYPALQAEIAAVTGELGSKGRVLVRPSGTEPLVRVFVEGQDESQIEGCARRIEKAVKENMV